MVSLWYHILCEYVWSHCAIRPCVGMCGLTVLSDLVWVCVVSLCYSILCGYVWSLCGLRSCVGMCALTAYYVLQVNKSVIFFVCLPCFKYSMYIP